MLACGCHGALAIWYTPFCSSLWLNNDPASATVDMGKLQLYFPAAVLPCNLLICKVVDQGILLSQKELQKGVYQIASAQWHTHHNSKEYVACFTCKRAQEGAHVTVLAGKEKAFMSWCCRVISTMTCEMMAQICP